MDIPLFAPPKLTGKYLHKTLASGWLTSGARCAELREVVAAFLNRRPEQVVLAASATAGFQAVVDLVRDRRRCWGDISVRLTPATWAGMTNAAHYPWQDGPLGAPDIYVRTDIGGARPSEYDASLHRPPCRVYVHDSCHSWLPHLDADFGLVSFYPTKLVPGAEGGAVICKNPLDAEPLQRLLYCGLVPGSGSREPKGWGRKANMTDVTAALNLEALELAPKYIEQIEEAWCTLSGAAYFLGIAHRVRQQAIRPYLFQLAHDFATTPPPKHCPWARNFAPANLITLPCFPGLTKGQAQDILAPFAS
jgi:DegT/DnrJ/EryC1/StrS aminotransferase family protein